jgi:hypothetical protein
MPKVVTTVNLDFDEKEQFVKKYGRDELSKFLRQAIHERLEKEKNEKASTKIDFSPIRVPINNKAFDIFNISSWIQTSLDYFRQNDDLGEIDTIKPQAQELVSLLNGKQMAFRATKKRFIR